MESIKETLMKKRDYAAEHRYLKQLCNEHDNLITEKQKERWTFLSNQLHCIDTWMSLLSEDEAYVVQRHLIDGIDIPRIAIEYRERWGEEYGKTDRTIKSYQRRALEKIDMFEQRKRVFC